MKKFYLPKPQPIRLSQAGIDNAKSEHVRLSKEREEILVRLQTAREMGDLSENGAYKYAKMELRDTDRRLRHLQKLLTYGVVVTSARSGVIDFGSRVKIKSDAGEMEFELVSGYESNPQEQKLSVYSPIGKAILGKKAGDAVEVETPSGIKNYAIVSVA